MMKKTFFSFILFLAGFFLSSAQELIFKASAPESVTKGDQFRLNYTLSYKENKDPVNFQEFDNIEGFTILMGPSISTSSSTSIINGETSISRATTFTYMLMPEKTGKQLIPAAVVKVGNKSYTSNPLIIEVLSDNNKETTNNPDSKKEASEKEELFITLDIPDKPVYEFQGFPATLRIYATNEIIQHINEVKFPDFDDFFIEEIELPEDRTFLLEHINGKNYYTAILKQFLLFPLSAGELKINSGEYNFKIRIKETNKNSQTKFFDQFTYTMADKEIKSPEKTIIVKKIPQNISSNEVIVGTDFKISSLVNNEMIKQDDSITLKINISGNGNIKFITPPKIESTNDYFITNIQRENSTRINDSGMSGSKIFTYTIKFNNQGKYSINIPDFAYFNPITESHEIIKNSPLDIEVVKSETSILTTENKIVPSDNSVGSLSKKTLMQEPFKLSEYKKEIFYFSLSFLILLIILYSWQISHNKNRTFLRQIPYLTGIVICAGLLVAFKPSSGNAQVQSQQSSRQPQTVKAAQQKKSIVYALDVSSSMLAEDFRPNRLEAAKEIITSFINDMKNSLFGITTFAKESEVLCLLTEDQSLLINSLKNFERTTESSKDGTAIGNGIISAINAMDTGSDDLKYIILITDGSNNTGNISPETATKIALAYNVKIYTIGLGTDKRSAKLPIETDYGTKHIDLPVKIDELMLTQIATATGGNYFRIISNDDINDTCSSISGEIENSKKGIAIVHKPDNFNETRTKQILEAFM